MEDVHLSLNFSSSLVKSNTHSSKSTRDDNQSIATEFQRQILGELFNSTNAPERNSTTVLEESLDEIVNSSTVSLLKEQSEGQFKDTLNMVETSDIRRKTLSPAKLAAFIAQQSPGLDVRRDTASPGSLKTVLQSLNCENNSSEPSENGSVRGSRRSSRETASPGRLQTYLRDDAEHAEVQAKQSYERRDRRTLTPSEMNVLKLLMSERIEAADGDNTIDEEDLESSKIFMYGTSRGGRRETINPDDLQIFFKSDGFEVTEHTESSNFQTKAEDDTFSFTDAFFSAKLLSKDDEGEENHDAEAKTKPLSSKKSRRSTLEPNDAESLFSELRREIHTDDADNVVVGVDLELEDDGSAMEKPNDLSADGETIDPDEALQLITDSSAILQEQEALEESDKVDAEQATQIELQDASNASQDTNISREGTPVSGKKRKQTGTPSSSDTSKRSKNGDGEKLHQENWINGENTAVSHDVENEATTIMSDAPESTANKSVSKPSEASSSETPDVFTSPVANNSKIRTPLKSCLSARKKKNGSPTPTKSVNFGPPRGAEFNSGSPSTSMTPMCDRRAKDMFPMEHSSPKATEEDEETSLNTSILDEVDALEAESVSTKKLRRASKSPRKQRRQSLQPQTSASMAGLETEKKRRRYSLRGVSPLDNMAEARRRRQRCKQDSEKKVQSTFSEKRMRGRPRKSASPPEVELVEIAPQGRLAYADSSSSGGEDMEITGDYSRVLNNSIFEDKSNPTVSAGIRTRSRSRSSLAGSKKSTLADSPVSPLSDGTVELGSLSDLIAEADGLEKRRDSGHRLRGRRRSSQRNTPKKTVDSSMEMDSDSTPAKLGSLSDLAKEDEQDQEVNKSVQLKLTKRQFRHLSELDDEEKTLDPIVEEEEDEPDNQAVDESQDASMMSLDVSESDEDSEYQQRRKNLVINLSSKFEKISTPSEKRKRGRTPASKTKRPSSNAKVKRTPEITQPKVSQVVVESSPVQTDYPLISLEEVVSRCEFDHLKVMDEDLYHKISITNNDSTADKSDATLIESACLDIACEEILRTALKEVQNWSNSLEDVLPALLSENAPNFVGILKDVNKAESHDLKESLMKLYELEMKSVCSGLLEWRASVEEKMSQQLLSSNQVLDRDITQLKARTSTLEEKQASEKKAIQELLDAELEMGQLFDAIEEQQNVREEFETSLSTLESECGTLATELELVQGEKATQKSQIQEDPVSMGKLVQAKQDVLREEQICNVVKMMTLWKVSAANKSRLSLTAKFRDLLFELDVSLRLTFQDTDMSEPIVSDAQVTSSEVIRNGKVPEDPGLLAQRVLMHPERLNSLSKSLCTQQPVRNGLLSLEKELMHSFDLLKDIRQLSCRFPLRFDIESSTLWVDLIRFVKPTELCQPRKLHVGFKLQSETPHLFPDCLQIQASEQMGDEITSVIAKLPKNHEYISSVCELLWQSYCN